MPDTQLQRQDVAAHIRKEIEAISRVTNPEMRPYGQHPETRYSFFFNPPQIAVILTALGAEMPKVRFTEEDQEGQVLYVRAYVGAVEIGEATIESDDQFLLYWMTVEYRSGAGSCSDRGYYESRDAALAAIKVMFNEEWANTWNAFFDESEEVEE